MMRFSSRDSMGHHIKSTHANGRALKLEALVLPIIMSDVPSFHVIFNCRWKDLAKLGLADPDFGTLGRVDMLLGADIFSHTVL